MALTEEQVKGLKEQLSQQIKDMPPGEKERAQAQIDVMSGEAIEEMLNQQREQQGQQIFRMIAAMEVDSVVVDENDLAICVLEINPASRGHALVIPKEAIAEGGQVGEGILNFAKGVAGKIQKNLKPRTVKVQIENKFGEVVIEVIPEYDVPITANSPRSQAKKEDLEKIRDGINTLVVEKPKVEKVKAKGKQKGRRLKLKRRIP